MADLLGLSARFIDEGVYEGPGSVNRVTTELSEVGAGIAVVEAFSHVVAFETDAGIGGNIVQLQMDDPAIVHFAHVQLPPRELNAVRQSVGRAGVALVCHADSNQRGERIEYDQQPFESWPTAVERNGGHVRSLPYSRYPCKSRKDQRNNEPWHALLSTR